MNTELETVGEVDNLIIGKQYLVPHVKMANGKYTLRSWFADIGSIILPYCPVIGDYHEDQRLLGVTDWHYHIDWRFFPEVEYAEMQRLLRDRTRKADGYRVLGDEDIDSTTTTMMAAECVRVMPEFPRQEIGMTLDRLQPAFKCSNVQKTMKCPHRNVPLRGLEVLNNCVRCPAHGMTWNIKTGAQASVKEMYKELALEGVD